MLSYNQINIKKGQTKNEKNKCFNNSIVYDKYSFYGRLDYLENPSQYFIELKAFLESLSNQSINTLEDANMVLKKK